MKIGIYLIDAVVTGTTKYAFELADGLRLAGHDVWTVTSTKSGKEPVRWTKADGGARWWHTAPNVTTSHDDLVSLFDYFDLVIVNDVGSSTLDKSEKYSGDLPGYVNALMQTRTRWVAVAHGNSYDEKHAPHFPLLLESSRTKPTAILATTAPYDYAQHELFKNLRAIHHKRPYRMRVTSVQNRKTPMAASLGRFSTGKNLHALGLTTPFYDKPRSLVLAGACISSARPTPSFETYEQLSFRDDIDVVQAPASPNKTSEWSVRASNGTFLGYWGSYIDPLPILEQVKLFVNMTAASFSSGTEYTTMEAIDAGCAILTSPDMVDPGVEFAYGALNRWKVPNSPKTTLKTTEAELRDLATRVGRGLDVPDDTWHDLASHNRLILHDEYEPSRVAQKLMNDLQGAS